MSLLRPRLLLALAALCSAQFAAAQTYHATPIANNLQNMAGGSYVVSGDDYVASVTLPFSFSFYGQSYNALYASTNGVLSFTSSSNSYSPQPMGTPAAAYMGAAIAPAWSDWVDTVTMETLGAAGSREVVFDWSGHEYYNGAQAHFQTTLFEGSNNIEFQYGDIGSYSHNVSAGIQNAAATEGLSTFWGYDGSVSSLAHTGVLISTMSPVPEPGTLAMLTAGLGFVGFTARKKKQPQVGMGLAAA